jgi:signal transduction histidine kinase
VAQKNHEMNETLQSRVAEEVIKNRKHQEMLFQQSKMASMGEMIGNIAHQWRQPLNALSALNVGLGIRYRAGKLTEYDMLKFKDKSNVLIQKMSDTIDDFRNFFYPDKSIELFRVDSAIEEAMNFIKGSYRINNIEIINNINTEIEIKNHKNELIQVLLNIFNNSKDAIKEFNTGDGIVTIGAIELKDSIIITIQDNGGGIDQAIIDRVFEPYFTTKFKDDGTGIGLYMSKMIIEESMHGKLTLVNKNNGVLATIVLDK